MSSPSSAWEKLANPEEKKVEKPPMQFQRLTPEMSIQKLKIAIHGLQKTGKTRFCLTSAKKFGPTYVISLDPGIKPLAKLFPDDEIYFIECYDPDATGIFEGESAKSLQNVDEAIRTIRQKVIADPKSVGTIVVDSCTEIWRWIQEYCKMEILKIDKNARVKNQWDWGPMNTMHDKFVMQLLSLPVHVILTGQDKAEGGFGNPTNEFAPRWQNQLPFKADIVIGLTKTKDKAGYIHYMGEIEDCRHMNEDLQPIAGKTFENLSFDTLVEALQKKSK